MLVTPHGPCPGLAVLPDTSREEILGALGLAERVKGLAKTISATLWDPEEEIAARRREIRGLRMELLAGSGLPEQRTALDQLQRALRELQVGNVPGSMGLNPWNHPLDPWDQDGTHPLGWVRCRLLTHPGVRTLVQH